MSATQCPSMGLLVLSALGTTLGEARTLQPIVQMAVTAAAPEGEVLE